MPAGSPLLGFRAELIDLTELDRLGRAGFRTGRFQADFLAVVAERALEGAAVFLIALDDSEGTGGDTVAASVADVRLNVDASEFCANDRAGGTGFKASGIFAVLAHVGRKRPRVLLARISSEAWNGRLLDELDVTPGGVAQGGCVVVGEAGELKSICIDAVPLLAGDFAGFAADAESGVGEERGGFAGLDAGMVGGSVHGCSSTNC